MTVSWSWSRGAVTLLLSMTGGRAAAILEILRTHLANQPSNKPTIWASILNDLYYTLTISHIVLVYIYNYLLTLMYTRGITFITGQTFNSCFMVLVFLFVFFFVTNCKQDHLKNQSQGGMQESPSLSTHRELSL